MRVGVFQCAGGGLTPEQRLGKLANAVKENDLDLMVCPELFLSGYNVGADVAALAEPAEGLFAEQVKQIAQSSGTAIVYGYPEKHGDQVYNSAACISRQGQLLANHRKLMIPPGYEEQYFDSGSGVSLFDLGGMTCGLLVCFDAEFPEAVRATVQAGAQLVIVPTALGEKWPVVAEKVMPARAFENGVWIVYANHAGEENGARFLGSSCIIAPDGTDGARAGVQEQVIFCDVDEASVLRAQNRLPFLPLSAVLKGRIGE